MKASGFVAEALARHKIQGASVAPPAQGEARTICSQHLPVLIHDPAQLAGRLKGAENLEPAEHKD